MQGTLHITVLLDDDTPVLDLSERNFPVDEAIFIGKAITRLVDGFKYNRDEVEHHE